MAIASSTWPRRPRPTRTSWPTSARPGLADREGSWSRIVIEKPFGHDLDSGHELNDAVMRSFDESQVYRIDHYLGKDTVRNLLVFRFANGIFEPVWNRRYVDHVQITVAEDLGVETPRRLLRGGRRQPRHPPEPHAAAAQPGGHGAAHQLRGRRAARREGARAAGHRHRVDAGRASTPTWCAASTSAGWVADRKVKGYREEPEVSPDSSVETYVALRLEVENWRWAGVPFYLRTGKHLPRRATEIAIQFNQPPLTLFKDSASDPEPNMLAMRIQPDEGILLRFAAKVPDLGLDVRSVNMDFTYGSTFLSDAPEAYETLLLDAMLGDASLFTRADEVEAAWSLVTPLNEMWREWGAGGGDSKGRSQGQARALRQA